LLQRDGVEVAILEHGMAFGEALLDAILNSACAWLWLVFAEEFQGLVRSEPVLVAGLVPGGFEVVAGGEFL
jgi:hypothetical protein